MNSSRLRELFSRALERPAAERHEFIAEASFDDPGLRSELLSLLSAFDEASSFLSLPARESLRLDDAGDPAARLIGKRIGRYRVERLIASGGMGSVYEALQDQPRRIAALKVIRSAIMSRTALRRFEYEAEILGRLRHPGIAQVFEAGTHRDGDEHVPYFAMEYIPDARNLVEYAKGAKLGVRHRLELFACVCDAVQHAHQNGFIHRDLKPGNILVDAAGQPKVVDFGVARASGGDAPGATLQTTAGQLIGTLAYMSPEQVSGDPHALDTRSDVYSLGVVCYELIAGRLPYDVTEKPLSDAIRTIVESAGRPLGMMDKAFRGEIETIVGKALEKEKDRRYQSAADFAADIRRHLHGEPIDAKRDSEWYVLKKTLRRHILPTTFAALFVLVVSVSAVVSTVFWQQSNRERLIAEQQEGKARASESAAIAAGVEADARRKDAVREEEKAREIQLFLQNMLASIDPDNAKGTDITVREVLDEASIEIQTEFADRPEIQSALLETVGRTYAGLALTDRAKAHLEDALAIRRQMYGDEHLDVARTLYQLAEVRRRDKSDWEEALGQCREALRIRRKLLGDDHPLTIRTMGVETLILEMLGDESVAQTAFYDTFLVFLTARQDWSAYPDEITEAIREAQRLWTSGQTGAARAFVLKYEARAYERVREMWRAGDHEGARAFFLKHFAPFIEHPFWKWILPEVMIGMAAQRCRERDYSAAEPIVLETLAVCREIRGDRHPQVAHALLLLAQVLTDRRAHEDAERACRESLDIRRSVLSDDDPFVAESWQRLGGCLQAQRKYEEAEHCFNQALSINESVFGEKHTEVASSRSRLGRLLYAQERYAEAEPIFQQVLAERRALLGPSHRHTGSSAARLSDCLRRLGRYDEAESHGREALVIMRQTYGREHRSTASALRRLGRALRAQEDYEAALPAYEESLSIYRKQQPLSLTEIRRTTFGLGSCLMGLERYEEAEETALALYAEMKENFDASDSNVVSAIGLLVRVYEATGDEASAAEYQAMLPPSPVE